jgi:hypothetical protein
MRRPAASGSGAPSSPPSRSQRSSASSPDIRDGALDDEIGPAVYYPFEQSATDFFAVVARTGPEPQALLPSLVATVRGSTPIWARV